MHEATINKQAHGIIKLSELGLINSYSSKAKYFAE